jgi:hypothetical protein
VVCQVRLEMLDRGFSLVNTPAFFHDDLFLRLRRRRMMLPADCNRWWKYPQLARHACWLEGLLRDALPEEAVALVALEFRHEPAGSVDEQVDRLHADGSYLRTVYTPYGPATIYREGDAELQVPSGRTLLMTAHGRARALGVPCTLHRRPGAGPERAVVVCSFEPHKEQPSPAAVYRQAAQTRRSRDHQSRRKAAGLWAGE